MEAKPMDSLAKSGKQSHELTGMKIVQPDGKVKVYWKRNGEIVAIGIGFVNKPPRCPVTPTKAQQTRAFSQATEEVDEGGAL